MTCYERSDKEYFYVYDMALNYARKMVNYCQGYII